MRPEENSEILFQGVSDMLYRIIVFILLIIIVSSCSFLRYREYDFNKLMTKSVFLVKKRWDGNYKKADLDSVRIKVRIKGRFAEVSRSMNYFNDSKSEQEGKFYLQKSDNQFISGFSMDVNGVMREGVITEKNNGIAAYKNLVRNRIDPGIVEIEDKRFVISVYPVQQEKSKNFIIKYIEEVKDGILKIPLDFYGDTEYFSCKIEADESIEKFIAAPEFVKQGRSWFYEEEDHNGREDFIVKLKNTEKGLYEKYKDKNYFIYRFKPEIRNETVPVDSVTVYWDNSVNNIAVADKNEDFLKRFIKKYNPKLIKLNIFSSQAEFSGRFNKSEYQVMFDTLKSIKYGSTSDFGLLDFSKENNSVLLFSDGNTYFAEKEITIGNYPVFCISSTLNPDDRKLKYIAEKSGGLYIDLRDNSEISGFNYVRNNIVKVKTESKADELALHYDNGEVVISGISENENNNIVLYDRFNKEYRIDLNNPEKGNLIYKFHANNYLQMLNRSKSVNFRKIKEISQKYKIMDKATSFVVLDRYHDYFENGIELIGKDSAEYRKFREEQLNIKLQRRSPRYIYFNDYTPLNLVKTDFIVKNEMNILKDKSKSYSVNFPVNIQEIEKNNKVEFRNKANILTDAVIDGSDMAASVVSGQSLFSVPAVNDYTIDIAEFNRKDNSFKDFYPRICEYEKYYHHELVRVCRLLKDKKKISKILGILIANNTSLQVNRSVLQLLWENNYRETAINYIEKTPYFNRQSIFQNFLLSYYLGNKIKEGVSETAYSELSRKNDPLDYDIRLIVNDLENRFNKNPGGLRIVLFSDKGDVKITCNDSIIYNKYYIGNEFYNGSVRYLYGYTDYTIPDPEKGEYSIKGYNLSNGDNMFIFKNYGSDNEEFVHIPVNNILSDSLLPGKINIKHGNISKSRLKKFSYKVKGRIKDINPAEYVKDRYNFDIEIIFDELNLSSGINPLFVTEYIKEKIRVDIFNEIAGLKSDSLSGDKIITAVKSRVFSLEADNISIDDLWKE